MHSFSRPLAILGSTESPALKTPSKAPPSTNDAPSDRNEPGLADLDRDVDTLLTSDVKASQVVTAIASRLLDLFHADGVAIALQQDRTVRCLGSAGSTAPDVGMELNVASGISGICFRSGISQYCFDARSDERVDAASCEALGIRSILVSPVLDGEQTVGLVEVFSVEDFFFYSNDIEQLERVATIVGRVYQRLLKPFNLTQVPLDVPAVPVPETTTPRPAPETPSSHDVTPQEIAGEARPHEARETLAALLPSFDAAPERVRSLNWNSLASVSQERITREPMSGLSNMLETVRANQRIVLMLGIAVALFVLLLAFWNSRGTRTSKAAARISPAATPEVSPALQTSSVDVSEPMATISTPLPRAKNSNRTASPSGGASARPSAPGVVLQPPASSPHSAATAPSSQVKNPASASPVLPDTSAPAVAVPPDTRQRQPEISSTPIVAENTTRTVSPSPQPAPADIPVTGNAAGGSGRNVGTTSDSVPTPAETSIPTAASIPAKPVISEVSLGSPISAPVPRYPALAKLARVQGEVVLSATINKEGRIADLRVVSGHEMLQQSAIDAVSRWRYKPYLLSGEPVDVDTTIKINFKLP